jgi:hypothetical protein
LYRIIEKDPYHPSILPCYLCSLVATEQKADLFYQAHLLVQAYPEKAVNKKKNKNKAK